jgi:hypothetical protein
VLPAANLLPAFALTLSHFNCSLPFTVALLQLIGQAAALELGLDISGYPSFAAEVEAMLT